MYVDHSWLCLSPAKCSMRQQRDEVGGVASGANEDLLCTILDTEIRLWWVSSLFNAESFSNEIWFYILYFSSV